MFPNSRRSALRLLSLVLLCVAAILAGPLAFAQSPPAGDARELVGVLDFEIVGGSKAQAIAVTNQLRSELLKTGAMTLVDRSQIEAILNEQALQQTGCTTQECAVEVGRILGIRKIIAGSLTKLDDNLWQVSAQMVDVETAETLKAETLTHDGDFRSLLFQGMAALAIKLAGAQIKTSLDAPGVLQLIGQRGDDTLQIDGKPVDFVEGGQYALPPGNHTLLVRRTGYQPLERSFELVPGGSMPLALDGSLQPISGTLTITRVPAGATARLLGGQHVSTQLLIPLPVRQRALPVGRYQGQVVGADGRAFSTANMGTPAQIEAFSFSVVIRDGEETVFDFAAHSGDVRRQQGAVGAWALTGSGGLIGLLAMYAGNNVAGLNADNRDLAEQMRNTTNSLTYSILLSTYESNQDFAKTYRAMSEVFGLMAVGMMGLGIYQLLDTDPGFEPVSWAPYPVPTEGGVALAVSVRW